jgi:hypothetical protein
LVPKYGLAGAYWTVFCHVDRPLDHLGHNRHRSTRSLASVPQPVRRWSVARSIITHLLHPLPLPLPFPLPFFCALYLLTDHPVGFWDSFKPVWVWDEKKKSKKKSKSSSAGGGSMGPIQVPGQPPPASATTGSAAPQINTSAPSQRNLAPRVEEVFDE